MSGLAGVSHILITPFTEDEQVDHDGLAAVVRAAIDARVASVVALGIMGEAHKLTDAERREVIRTVVAHAGPATPVVAGVSAESTIAAVQRAEEAEEAGASYVMLAPPRGAAANDVLVDHYARVAESTAAGLIVQDEPVSTGVVLPASFFARLADQIPAIAAAKVEESPSPSKISSIREAVPGLDCLGGLGGVSLLEELERGAVGTMTGFAFPGILRRIYDAFVGEGYDAARATFYQFLPLIRFEAQLGTGGVGIRKQLFFERGIIANPAVRSPASSLDRQTIHELRALLAYFELVRSTDDRHEDRSPTR